MTLAEKFWKWEHQERVCFKTEEHEFIVHQFDAGAEVTFFSKYPDGDGYYDDQTLVKFSDGSKTNFNYKGEGLCFI